MPQDLAPNCPGRLRTGPERSEFFYIAALPKSASSFAWLVASAVQERNGRANPDRLPTQLPSPFLPLQLSIRDLFATGGVYKSHAPWTGETDYFLTEVGCKYAVLVRHPADFIPALYCHLLGEIQSEGHSRSSPTAWIHVHTPVRRAAFGPQVGVDEAIEHLIRDGCLFEALVWMTKWLTYRDPSRSVVITYETLVYSTERAARELSLLIRGVEPSLDTLEYLLHACAGVAEEKLGKNDKYPRGWTGKAGIWRDYFSIENTMLYNDVVNSFISVYPNGRRLLTVYPDLYIAPDSSLIYLGH